MQTSSYVWSFWCISQISIWPSRFTNFGVHLLIEAFSWFKPKDITVIHLFPFFTRYDKVERASSLLTNFIFILRCSLYTHVISARVLNKNTLWSTFCSDGNKYNRITFYYYRYNPFEKICLQWRLRKDTISLHIMQWCLGRSLNRIYNKL